MSRFYALGNPATPLLVLAAIVSSNTAHADAVDWNAITSKAIITATAAGLPGPATACRPRLGHGVAGKDHPGIAFKTGRSSDLSQRRHHHRKRVDCNSRQAPIPRP